MNRNLWMYSTPKEMRRISASLIILGANVLKSARIIKEVDQLKVIYQKLNNNTLPPADPKVNEFIFDYLIDSIKILIFFENYMKAELISNGFCVYRINGEVSGFKDIAKRQFKEPITIEEINLIHPFEINELNESISHKALKDITLGFNELTKSSSYLSHYKFDKNILTFIKELNTQRNKLHFHDSIHFIISDEFISKLEDVTEFVEYIIRERIGSKL